VPPQPPSEKVLGSFGLIGSVAQPVSGGQGRTWSAGGRILKPVDDPVEAAWVGDTLLALADDGFRISRPVKSASDTWVVDGWSAWELLAGEHDTSGRWVEVLRVGDRLNAALCGLPRPGFLDARTHAWAVGDRVAWGEEPLHVVHQVLRPLVDRLSEHLIPDGSPSQVIHGDLTGNVLFAPGLAPGVIDFTPYWRPQRFSLAIVVVDALLWHGASSELPDALPSASDRGSLLARAALYRLITSDRLAVDREPRVQSEYLRSVLVDHERVLQVIERSDSHRRGSADVL
jgi:uncharacterized protein (TIGR02569 family)